jgi:peptidyl-dipeptidase Dcp
MTEINPLLAEFDAPFGMPPFAEVTPAHFPPAFEAALAEARAELEAIAANPAPPDFANTIEAMERAGRRLSRISAVFFNLCGADTNAELEAIQQTVAPQLARFTADTLMNGALFARVDALSPNGLTAEQARVLDLTHRRFVRAGARLDEAGRARMTEIMERLASLGTRFAQNVLADERDWSMPLAEADLAGLPDFVVDAAADAARARDAEGHVVTLSRSLIEPFLSFCPQRALRERAFHAWASRGEGGGETDTAAIVTETLALRRERARMLGFENYAAFKLDPEMAGTPAAVRELLERVWTPARARATEEATALAALMAEDGQNGPLEPWDWRYYAEKRRAAEFDLDEAELKPFFRLDAMIDAAFDCATRLFGLSFTPLPDVAAYHPDARVWEVTRDGRHMGLFIGDYFARPSKRSGAWCSGFRQQEKLDGEVRPIVVNVMNFARGGADTLLTFDDAETLFHEFGHALHALLSDVTYPSISGTSVARDFVELPSQLYEHWLGDPVVLATHAVNAAGKAIPASLIARLEAARTYNQGFATVEYTASALVDLALHEAEAVPDPIAFEAEVLARIGMPHAIIPRHRVPHFAHVFAGEGYAAGYYSYMWSEVMDADAFAAFEEAGDVFDAETARKLELHILGAGGRQDPAEAYKAFRGRLPGPEAMLAQRGLAA